MHSKLVSIIIPNYNSLKFIKETLDCVFNQTHKNLEVIIVDDGSTDGSFEWIANLNQPNLKLAKNPKKGACAARNHGLRLAKGDYIQFLDADDVLDHDKIKAQVTLLENEPTKVAICSTRHFYETIDEGVITDASFLDTTDTPGDFLLNLYGGDGINHNMVAQHAWLTPKSVMDKAGFWNEELVKDQDGEFFCRVAMASQGICFAEGVLCYYRKHRNAGSISSGKTEKHISSQFESLNSKAEQLSSFKDTKAYKNAMALQYKIIAIDAYPKHLAIYKTAIQNVKYFGGSAYMPVLGGKLIESIKHLFGWRAAKAFSVFAHKYIKS
ncbi:glycosyltransferase family 2 protein [Gelidibacter gilvus]|uniref:Glycosyltransferase family 2 protein n=1 Tax=Gelidibacter gilvus TaxID=59602 RepID=A0A4V1LMQ0_9FLAO|nr:glycosyltransferase family A protein [Gelidibacter gilvus]RXJ46043.1 glycosyltransferase family 2 protein [Gelidibacter gilvus]